MIRLAARAVLISAALLTAQGLASCQAYQDAFLMVQLCPGGPKGEADLKALFANLARTHEMTLIDGNPGEFSLKGKRGSWVLVSHVNAPENQTLIAFFERPRQTRVHDLATTAQAQLAQHWTVETLPLGVGVQGKACPKPL